jgi:hypothetical protein
MSQSPARSWTIDERVDFWQRRGLIKGSAFTPDERLLEWSLGAAWHFWACQKELPALFLDQSPELESLDMGISRLTHLTERRDTPPTSPGTKA